MKIKLRRIVSVVFIVFGGILILLAPETWFGVVLLSLGVVVELAGMMLGHQPSQRRSQ
jgi:hypothetical protein